MKTVCLCGSSKFEKEFEEVNNKETIAGNIVLSVGWFGHSDPEPLSSELKQKLDKLNKCKINLADEVYVINVNNYIGSSTKSEIEYATNLGKPIRYLESELTKEQIENALATIRAVYNKNLEESIYFRGVQEYKGIVIMLTEALEKLN